MRLFNLKYSDSDDEADGPQNNHHDVSDGPQNNHHDVSGSCFSEKSSRTSISSNSSEQSSSRTGASQERNVNRILSTI